MSRKYPEVYKSVAELIYDTAYQGMETMSIDQLAEVMNVERSALYRWLNPYDDKANFPAKLLKNLMTIKKDTRILEALAFSLGFMLIKAPHGTLKTEDRQELINNFQFFSTRMVQEFMEYYRDPTEQKRRNVLVEVDRVLLSTASIKERVKKDVNQADLFNNE